MPFPSRERSTPDAPQAASPPSPGPLAKKAESAAATRGAAAQGGSNAAPRGAADSRLADLAPGRPMAALVASLGREGDRWRRVDPATGTAVALDAAWRAWLVDVDAAAVRWQADDPRATGRVGAASAAAVGVSLERDGVPDASLRIEDGGIVYQPRGGPAWFAPLAPETVARLRAGRPPTR